MPVMDEFKEERAALKDADFKTKWKYFWDYYKLHVVVTAFALVMIITLVVQIAQRKETVFYAVMMNGGDLTGEPANYITEFSEYAEIDTDEQAAIFDTTIFIDFDNLNEVTTSSLEKMMVYIAAQEIDVVVTGTELMEYYAYGTTFMDLRDFLTEEQIAKYEPYFYYIDQAIVEEKEAAQDAMNYDFTPTYPADPRDPAAMKEPIPVGIYLDENAEEFLDNYYVTGGEPVVSVIINTTRPEMASTFIEFIFQDMTSPSNTISAGPVM